MTSTPNTDDAMSPEEREHQRRVRALLRRVCCSEPAPARLRERISVRITEVRRMEVDESGSGTSTTIRRTQIRRDLPPQP